MAKINELRELDDRDLALRLDDSKKELFNLRFQLATGRLDNVARIRMIRREIAQVRTLQVERGADSSAVKEQ
jgi:large subunit ribosomal protein L29